MEDQERYDQLCNLILNIDTTIEELDKNQFKDCIDGLNEIKFEAQNEMEEVEERLQEEAEKEIEEENKQYERSVI